MGEGESLTGAGSTLYFSLFTAGLGRELWKSDGTGRCGHWSTPVTVRVR